MWRKLLKKIKNDLKISRLFFILTKKSTIQRPISYVSFKTCLKFGILTIFMMKKTRIFTLTYILFIAIQSIATQSCSQTPEQVSGEAQLQQSVLDYVNQYRKNKGLAPLQMLPVIVEEALRHSKNIADEKVAFGHDGFDGRADRLMGKIASSNAIAENVAYGKFSAQEVVNRWIESAGHRKNIEGKYTLTGIGIVRRNDGYLFFTQIFINK